MMTQYHKKNALLEHAGPGNPTTPTKAAVASSDNAHNGKLISDEDIRLFAYQKWVAAGKPVGDGVQFWLEAEQEMVEGKTEKLDQRDGRHGNREHQRLEAEKVIKECNVSEDSHYRDNNRMFQSHGERGHRHGGSG